MSMKITYLGTAAAEGFPNAAFSIGAVRRGIRLQYFL